MDFQDIKQKLLWNPRALWKLVQQCFWMMNRFKLQASLINLYFIIVVIFGHFAVIPLVRIITPIRRWQDILTTLLSMPLTAFAGCGLILYYLNLVRTQKSSPILLFKVFRPYFYNLLFLVAYYILYVFLIKYVIYIEYEGLREEFTPKLQLFLGFILFVFFLSRFLFAPAYIMDHSLSTKSGFKYSLLLTSTRGTRTFIVTLTFLFIFALGALPSGIIVLTWLWYDLSPIYLWILIPTFLLFAYSMGPGLIAYVRMYDLYQQDIPGLKDLAAPPHPVLLQRPEIEDKEVEQKIKKKSSKKKKSRPGKKKSDK